MFNSKSSRKIGDLVTNISNRLRMLEKICNLLEHKHSVILNDPKREERLKDLDYLFENCLILEEILTEVDNNRNQLQSTFSQLIEKYKKH